MSTVFLPIGNKRIAFDPILVIIFLSHRKQEKVAAFLPELNNFWTWRLLETLQTLKKEDIFERSAYTGSNRLILRDVR